MEPKEAMQMAKEILPYLEDSSGKETLRNKYMTEEERKSLEREKEWRQVQEKRMRKLREERKIKKEFNFLIQRSKRENLLFGHLYGFYYYDRYSKNSLQAGIVLSFLRDYLARREKIRTSKKEIERLFELLVRLYKDGLIEVESVRQMVDKMEVE